MKLNKLHLREMAPTQDQIAAPEEDDHWLYGGADQADFNRYTGMSTAEDFVVGPALAAIRKAQAAINASIVKIPQQYRAQAIDQVIAGILRATKNQEYPLYRSTMGKEYPGAEKQFNVAPRYAPIVQEAVDTAVNQAAKTISNSVVELTRALRAVALSRSGQRALLKGIIQSLLNSARADGFKYTLAANRQNDQGMEKQIQNYVQKALEAGRESVYLNLKGMPEDQVQKIVNTYKAAIKGIGGEATFAGDMSHLGVYFNINSRLIPKKDYGAQAAKDTPHNAGQETPPYQDRVEAATMPYVASS